MQQKSGNNFILTENGFSVIESLFVLLISSLIMGATLSGYLSLSTLSHDNEVRVLTQLKAQTIIEMITPEIRMLGNGVPFHQSNFLIDQATLNDKTVTEPILVSDTTEHKFTFRLNESGETYILTQDLNPETQNTIHLTSTEKISQGDTIYITNSTVGLDDGLYGTVASLNNTSVTLAINREFHPGAIFPSGSLLEVVSVISYHSEEELSPIIRQKESLEDELVPLGRLTFSYINSSGNPITLPLLATSAHPFPNSAIQNVQSVMITVEVESDTLLSGTKKPYLAKVSQVVGIRNLNYKY
ncbi:MAG TPA: hypothetical protein PKA63_07795 [Oligoflexia bacterium]|nr:hypothetical protein [Oligoflexia bacterium]HMP48552.1 hypothetical protein [Oligoflexia bacterium]